MDSITESHSHYSNIDRLSIFEIIKIINNEDKLVAFSVEKSLLQINKLVAAVLNKLEKGGRLFYIGAGTSGRLGILDAAELPPTYGVSSDKVIGIIAGGDVAIKKAVEGAEDNLELAKNDLKKLDANVNDFVIGISASGRTPYVLGGLLWCKENNIQTGCIVCNLNSIIAEHVDFPVEVVVGPEVITGSTRMKAGTAQKMILNMISTTLMIKLGKVKGNKMVDMVTHNSKLFNRGKKIIMEELGVNEELAVKLLNKYGSVRKAIESYNLESSDK